MVCSLFQQFPCRTDKGICFAVVGKLVFFVYTLPRAAVFIKTFCHRHVGRYLFIMTDEEIFFCAVLAVGNDGVNAGTGIVFVLFDKGRHPVSLIDSAGCDGNGSDDLMVFTHYPMRFVSQFCLALAGPYNGCVGIGGRDEPFIDRAVFIVLIESFLQFCITGIEIALQ